MHPQDALELLCENNGEQICRNLLAANMVNPLDLQGLTTSKLYHILQENRRVPNYWQKALQNVPYNLGKEHTRQYDILAQQYAKTVAQEGDDGHWVDILGAIFGNSQADTPPPILPPQPAQKPSSMVVWASIGIVLIGAVLAIYITRKTS